MDSVILGNGICGMEAALALRARDAEVLAGGPIPLNRNVAIEVDDTLKASPPDVGAARDCANVTWANGSRRPEQLRYTARDSVSAGHPGRTAAVVALARASA